MALSPTLGTVLALALDGKDAGPLRSAQPPSLQVDMLARQSATGTVLRRGTLVTLGEMAAELALVGPGPLTDWAAAALAGDLSPHGGTLQQGDMNFKLQRTIDFRGARLCALDWSPLDARDSKQPVLLSLRWLVDSVDDRAGNGTTMKGTVNRRKALLRSNFRVVGLPFDGLGVSQVGLPGLQQDWSTARAGMQREPTGPVRRQLGPLVLTVEGRQAQAARDWVHKLLADGSVDESEGLALQVDLLDATLKKVLASFTFTGCLLLGLDEGLLDADSGRSAPSVVLRFDVGGMKFAFA